MTGGRIKRIKSYVGEEPFLMTYGDGVSDVDLKALVKFHKEHGKVATLTSVQPDVRFGMLEMEDECVKAFREKDQEDAGWINGGYMVFQPEIFDYLDGDETILEREPLETLAKTDELMAYKHDGFWQCMDTQRDKQLLEELYNTDRAPWRSW
jgi:glucose-1-phosphate cytidylyltransferase